MGRSRGGDSNNLEAVLRAKVVADTEQAEGKINKTLRNIEKNAERAANETEQTAQQAERFVLAMEKARKRQAFKDIAQQAAEAGQLTNRLKQELIDLGATDKEIEQVTNQFVRLQRALEENRRFTFGNELEKQLDVADRANTQFRRRVDIIGDVDTGFQTTFGLASSTLGSNTALARGLNITGDAFGAVEGIVQLRSALGNLTPTLKAVYQSLGGAKGIGLIGGLGALAIVYTQLAKGVDTLVKAESARLRGITEASREISQLTQDELKEKISSIEQEIRLNESLRDQNKEFLDDLKDDAGDLPGIIGDISDAKDLLLSPITDRITGQDTDKRIADIKAYEDEIAKLDEEIAKGKGTLEVYTDALGGNLTATNDAAEALRVLNEEQEKLNRARGDRAANVIAFLAEEGRTSDEIQEYIQSMRNQRLEIVSTKELLEELGFEDQAAELTEDLQLIGFELSILANSTNSTVVALREYAELEQQLLEARERATAVASETENAINKQIQRETFLSTVTADNIQNRLDGLNIEKQAILDNIGELENLEVQSDESQAALERYRNRLEEIDETVSFLSAEASMQAAINAMVSYREDIVKINDALADKIEQIQARLAQALADARRKLDAALADAARTRDEKLRQAEEKAADARADALEKKLTSLADLEQDIADKRREILEKSRIEVANAIARRDALALFLAQQEKETELEELRRQEERKREEIEKSYERQIRDINRKLEEQRRDIERAYSEQVRAAHNAYAETVRTKQQEAQDSINIERQRAQELINARAQALNQELQMLSNFSGQGVGFIQAFVSGALASLSNLSTSSTSPSSLYNPNLPAYSVVNQQNSNSFNFNQATASASQISQTIFDILSSSPF